MGEVRSKGVWRKPGTGYVVTPGCNLLPDFRNPYYQQCSPRALELPFVNVETFKHVPCIACHVSCEPPVNFDSRT